MMAKKLITVLGITGTQGSSVATHFLKHTNTWSIRGITRNPASAKAKAWASKGVEVVQGDQNDIDSLKRAFTGSSAIYSVTDYPSNYARVLESEELQKKAAEQGKSINEYAHDLEIAQGVNVANAAADPAVLSTLDIFVQSTLTAIKRISKGKYPDAFQFDSKANIEQYIRDKQPQLAQRLSTVNLGAYQENWRDMALFGPQKQADGSFAFLRLKWPGPHTAHPEVVASVDTGAFVEGLVLNHPPGTKVLGATGIITKEEYAALWGRIVGQKAAVKDLSEEEFSKHLPDDIRDELLNFFKFVTEYGYAGGDPEVKTPAELGIKTSTLEEFIKNEDWSKALSGENLEG